MTDTETIQQMLDRAAATDLVTKLRLLHDAGCTGSISVNGPETVGVIFFEAGEVVDALVTDGPWVGEGIPAVAFLANVPDEKVSYSTSVHFGKQTIVHSFDNMVELVAQAQPLLLPPPAKKGMPKRRRSAAVTASGADRGSLPSPDYTPFDSFFEAIENSTEDADERSGAAPNTGGLSTSEPPHSSYHKETIMALENYLAELRGINGYLAAGIMSFTGEMLVSDAVDSKIDLNMVGAMFNDIFRSAHEASKKIGLDACKETTITTPLGAIVMRCSGVDAKAHVHLISILRADGNHALARMQMDKIVNPIMDELA